MDSYVSNENSFEKDNTLLVERTSTSRCFIFSSSFLPKKALFSCEVHFLSSKMLQFAHLSISETKRSVQQCLGNELHYSLLLPAARSHYRYHYRLYRLQRACSSSKILCSFDAATLAPRHDSGLCSFLTFQTGQLGTEERAHQTEVESAGRKIGAAKRQNLCKPAREKRHVSAWCWARSCSATCSPMPIPRGEEKCMQAKGRHASSVQPACQY